MTRSRMRTLGYLLGAQLGCAGRRRRSVLVKLARAYQQERWRSAPRRLGSRVDAVPLDRPIFLLGTQGCGGTLVGRCLRHDPAVITVSGGWRHWTGTDELGIVASRMARLPPSLWGSSNRQDIQHPTYGCRHSGVFACEELFGLYRGRANDGGADDARVLRRLLREHIAVFADDPARARFLDKTHAYTVKMPLLAALLEGSDPIFVLVVRDPVTSCSWTLERKPPSFTDGLSLEERLQALARHWANAHRAVLDDARVVPNVAAVRFEDFLEMPEQTVRSLCAFVGLDFEPSMVPGPDTDLPWATLPTDRKWYPLYTDDRRDRVSPEARSIVERLCEEVAARFGYGPGGREPWPDPVQVLRP